MQVYDWLGDCGIRQRSSVSGFGSDIVWSSSRSYKWLNAVRNEWYSDKGRTIPSDLSWINNFSVAKWYMDDGSLSHSELQQDRAIFLHTDSNMRMFVN